MTAIEKLTVQMQKTVSLEKLRATDVTKRLEFAPTTPDTEGVSEHGARHLRNLNRQEMRIEKANCRVQWIELDAAKRIVWAELKRRLNVSGSKFIAEGNFSTVINGLILYFINSPDSPYDLFKGIYLHGEGGTGKSTIMAALQVLTNLQSSEFATTRVPELIANIKNNSKIDHFTHQYYGIRCFDDIAFAPSFVVDYGNEINVMADIINRRYNHFLANRKITHFISNYSIEMLEVCVDGKNRQFFDTLIRSRIKKMCTEIQLIGNDKRLI